MCGIGAFANAEDDDADDADGDDDDGGGGGGGGHGGHDADDVEGCLAIGLFLRGLQEQMHLQTFDGARTLLE